MNYWAKIKHWAKSVKRDIGALWIAARDPRTPLKAKIVAITIVSYALSPIDLIPDFIPVLGFLDDIIIIPLGIWMVVKLVPDHLMEEFRSSASLPKRLPSSRAGLLVVLAIWIAIAIVTWRWFQ